MMLPLVLRICAALTLIALLPGTAVAIDLRPGDIVALRVWAPGQPLDFVRIDPETGVVESFHSTNPIGNVDRITSLPDGQIAVVAGRDISADVSTVLVVDPVTGSEEIYETERFLHGGIAALSDGDIALTGSASEPSPMPDEWTSAWYGVFRLSRESGEFTDTSRGGGLLPVDVLFRAACDDLVTLSSSQVGWDGVTRIALASGAQLIKPLLPAVRRGSNAAVASTLSPRGQILIAEPRSATSTTDFRLVAVDPRTGLSTVVAPLPRANRYTGVEVGPREEIYLYAANGRNPPSGFMAVDPMTAESEILPLDAAELGIVIAFLVVPDTDSKPPRAARAVERRRCRSERWRLLNEHLNGFPLNSFRKGARR